MLLARQIGRVGSLTSAALLLAAASAAAQQRTDVIQFINGDKITGEIKKLDRGSLRVRTNDLGTVEIKWDRVAGVIASRRFEVETTVGRTYLGSLAAADPGQVTVTEGGAAVTLALMDIVRIAPIGSTFWQQLEGHLDLGFQYTRSSEVLQVNVDYETVWVRPSFNTSLIAQTTLTKQPGTSDSGRTLLRATYVRKRGTRWVVGGAAQADRNREQGIDLRASGSFLVGRLLLTTNTVDSTVGGGISINEEYAVDAPATTNAEGLFAYQFSYFTQHFPKTGFDLDTRLIPSLNQLGRVRFEISSAIRREIFRDFTVAISFYDTFDSRPPGATEDGTIKDVLKNDYGIVTSIGWIF